MPKHQGPHLSTMRTLVSVHRIQLCWLNACYWRNQTTNTQAKLPINHQLLITITKGCFKMEINFMLSLEPPTPLSPVPLYQQEGDTTLPHSLKSSTFRWHIIDLYGCSFCQTMQWSQLIFQNNFIYSTAWQRLLFKVVFTSSDHYFWRLTSQPETSSWNA